MIGFVEILSAGFSHSPIDFTDPLKQNFSRIRLSKKNNWSFESLGYNDYLHMSINAWRVSGVGFWNECLLLSSILC